MARGGLRRAMRPLRKLRPRLELRDVVGNLDALLIAAREQSAAACFECFYAFHCAPVTRR